VYSSVILVLAWPAILEASMAEPPTSCRQVMLARRKESGPKPGKSQPSSAVAFSGACRTPESQSGRPLPFLRVNTSAPVSVRGAIGRGSVCTSALSRRGTVRYARLWV
jgi:hypothetical protein